LATGSVTAEDLKRTPLKGPAEAVIKRINQVRAAMEDANQPIRFYGKVIDQDGAPLPGVKVALGVRRTSEVLPGLTNDGSDRFEIVTDEGGRFQLTDAKGALLGVKALEKVGYEASSQSMRYFWYYENENKKYRPDANTPEVFRMWKLVGAERLITADKFYGVVPDGRGYAVDVLTAKKVEGGNAGDFKVSIKRPAQIDAGSKYDWSCLIEGIGGGVVETQDEFMYRAPESGYQPRYEVKVPASDPQWSDRAKRQLYLKSRDGKVYARMDVEILANYQNKAVFNVKYYANPTGSRNLEYDPLQDVVKSAQPQSAATPPKP
jgi:hypothetical protein